jgi:hypothetical protein
MSLSDALQRERELKIKGPPCQVCVLVDSLPVGEDRDYLVTALADASFTGEGISRALVAEGYQIQGQTIQRHRRGICRGSV